MNVLERLESGREALDGSPSRALRLLPPRGSLPPSLRAERDLVAADAWRAMGFFRRAEEAYGRVLRRRSESAQDPPLWIEAALGSAAGLRSLGVLKEAAARLGSAKRCARRARIRVYDGRIALEEALLLRAEGRHARSIALLKPMLSRAMRSGDLAEAAYIHWALGGAYRTMGRLRESVVSFRRSLALAKRASDPVGAGYACLGLGGSCRVMGRMRDSARCYTRAGRMFRGSDDVFARAYALCGLANASRQLGKLRRAERLYRKAHVLYSRLDDAADLAFVEWGLGEVDMGLGRQEEAGTRFRKALAAFRRYAETRGEVLASVSLARQLHASGRTREAERLFAAAYRLAKRKNIHAHLETYT